MAKPNIFVTIITFLGFVVNLINFALFNQQIPFWFGYIFNTIGTIASISFFVKAGCIQSIFYKERYENEDQSDNENGVIEIVTTERDVEAKPSMTKIEEIAQQDQQENEIPKVFGAEII